MACDCTIVTIHYIIWYNHSAIVRLRFVREVYIYKPSSVENIYFELKKLTQKAVQSVMRFLIWNVETESNQLSRRLRMFSNRDFLAFHIMASITHCTR